MIAIRLLALAALAATLAPAETLRVMSFNVRCPSPGDGANVWSARRDLFVETVRSRHPDVMGTQELFFEQGQYVAEKLPDYAWFGLSRRGNHEDEHMGVFYRKSALRLLDSGDFWLSPTPEKPASMDWKMDLPRMVTWGLFETVATGRRFLLLNTHFPHREADEAARQKCARLLAMRIGIQDETLPILITGDFNAPVDGPTYQALIPGLHDAWKEAATRTGPVGSFHGFKGTPRGDRIDWILFRAPWRVTTVETITDHKENVYPSDHLPVLAVFELP
jgi:endonuclease/exonuclease/phosphatase family metal-dependent hydrolase